MWFTAENNLKDTTLCTAETEDIPVSLANSSDLFFPLILVVLRLKRTKAIKFAFLSFYLHHQRKFKKGKTKESNLNYSWFTQEALKFFANG